MLKAYSMSDHFNIVYYFFDAANKYPDKVAIIKDKESITFGRLAEQVLQTSQYFIDRGIEKGDRVLVFVPMSIDLYRIILSLFHIGAIAVFLDEWVNKKRMEMCCQVAQCKVLIGSHKFLILSFLSHELRRIPIKLSTFYPRAVGIKNHSTLVEGKDTALLTFTTGSTGVPKAAKRTHGFLNEQLKALIDKINPNPNDVDLVTLPIVLLVNLGTGCTSVIAQHNARKPASFNGRRLVDDLKKHTVNRCIASPYFVQSLSRYVLDNNIIDIALDKLFVGGAPVFPVDVIFFKKAFPLCDMEIIYGSTEAEPISSIKAPELLKQDRHNLRAGLNVGKPSHLADVRIIDRVDGAISCSSDVHLEELVLPVGQLGEIIVRGPHVLTEYYNNSKALKENKIRYRDVCWHRTGDSGYLDTEGNLYLTGRCNALIMHEGKLIAPFIYENYLKNIEGIEIGTVLEQDGNIMLFVELCDLSWLEKVNSILESSDLFFESIKYVKKIPRDPRHHSKIDYLALSHIQKRRHFFSF
jgi:acyl-CoA synthetase (AMP-forming)/AMP-acid ligase II